MPLKSLTMFLILAWVIISWPLSTPPKSSPMITSTIAISTKVKPASVEFLLKLDKLMQPPKTNAEQRFHETRKIYAREYTRTRPFQRGRASLFLLKNGHLRRLSDTLP